MEIKQEQSFAFMEASYRYGVIDKILPLLGQSIDGLQEATGLSMEGILDKLDGAKEETIEKMDRYLGYTTPLLSIATKDWAMKLLSRLLDFQVVRHFTMWFMQKYFERVIAKSEGTLKPLSQRMKGWLIGSR